VRVFDSTYVHWTSRVFSASAPEPFGPVVFAIEEGYREHVVELRIAVSGEWLAVSPDIYSDLVNVRNIRLTYPNSIEAEVSSDSFIEFEFASGSPKSVNLKKEYPDYKCGGEVPCRTYVTDSVVLRVYADRRIERIERIDSSAEDDGWFN
jgi:hypothetical protein